MQASQFNTITLLFMLIRANGVNTISSCGQLTTDTVIPLLTNAYHTHHWPWHAALYHQLDDEAAPVYKCGGSLITSKSILTAAHCVCFNNVPLRTKQVSVSLGKINLAASKATDQSFVVAEIIVHPDYSSIDYANDIAIIKVTVDAIFDNYVQPICLWNVEKTDLTEVIGKLGTVVGWGLTESDKISNVLLQASLPVVDYWTCLLSNRDVLGDLITKTNFCAGFQNGTSVCTGDSGGSMSFEDRGIYYIRGIVSVGTSKTNPVTGELICNPTQFALFTDVAQYLSWIIDNTRACEKSVACKRVDDHTCTVTFETAKTTRKCKMIFNESSNGNATEIKFQGESFVIPDLSDAITKFENLQILRFTRIGLRNVENASLTAFKKLRQLDLSENVIRQLRSDTFDGLENLQGLFLYSNRLTEISVDLFKRLDNLEEIDLSLNDLTTLPANIFRFNKNLRNIELDGNSLSELDSDIFAELPSLEIIFLRSNQLETIPVDIFRNNENLKEIHLENNHLKELHSDLFSDIRNLEEIYLFENQFATIPGNIFRNNGKLQHINLISNQLRELHSDLFRDLTHLERVFLDGNQIESIPGNIFRNNTKLKDIGLSKNQLRELHSNLFRDLNHLELVSLNDNQIETIPGNIFRNNTKLEFIDLNRNQLRELHSNLFRDLNHLERVLLNENQIEVIPKGLFETNTKLRGIELKKNRIKKIEVDFTQIPQLAWLYLEDNVCFDLKCHLDEHCGFSSFVELIEEIHKKCSVH